MISPRLSSCTKKLSRPVASFWGAISVGDENDGVVRHDCAIETPHKYGVSWKYTGLAEMDDNIAVGIWNRRIRCFKDPHMDRWRCKTVWSAKTYDSDRRYSMALLGLSADMLSTGEGWALAHERLGFVSRAQAADRAGGNDRQRGDLSPIPDSCQFLDFLNLDEEDIPSEEMFGC